MLRRCSRGLTVCSGGRMAPACGKCDGVIPVTIMINKASLQELFDGCIIGH